MTDVAATDETASPEMGDAAGDAGSSLRHILVVGGTVAEWAALSDADWAARTDWIAALCERLGVPWLTIRVYEQGIEPPCRDLAPWHRRLDGCHVIVDPFPDGRRRFADAMAALDPRDEVNEDTVAAALYEPADSEPDLVVVLGPATQLPPSLVWELAYAELVFIPVAWADFELEHLRRAIADFAGRRRRFGGLDDDVE